MRRRRIISGGTLDSLTDVMCNGVGILVVVVAVTRISVTESIRRVQALEALEEMSPEAAAEAARHQQRIEELLAEIAKSYGPLDSFLLDKAVTVEDIKRVIPDLEMIAKDPSVLPARQDADILQQLMELEIAVSEHQKDLERCKAALDLAKGRDPRMRNITLPERHSPGRDMSELIFLCRDGALYPFRDQKLAQILGDALKELLGQNHAITTIELADFPRIELHFATNVIGDEFIRMRIKNMQDSLLLVFEPRNRQQGQTTDDLDKQGSPYARMIQEIDKEKYYIRFFVWGDSFDVYIKAREMAQAAGILAGWEPFSIGAPLEKLIKGDAAAEKGPREVVD